MAKTTSVHLRVYKGTEILKREDGSVKNENWTVAIDHGSAQWNNFMKNTLTSGWCKIEVEKVIEVEKILDENGAYQGKEKETEVKDIEKFKKELADSMKGNEKPLTKEEQRIKDLEEQNKAFQERLAKLEGGSGKKETKSKNDKKDDDTKKDDSSNDISALREQYKELNPEGKGASPKWDADTLKEKIEGFKSK